MDISLRQRQAGESPNAAIMIVAALALIPVGLWGLAAAGLNQCLFYEFVGLPCFLCGGTEATSLWLDGRVIEAFSIQPLVSTTYAAAAASVLGSIGLWLSGRRLTVDISTGEQLAGQLIVLGLLIAHWGYLVWIGT